MPMICQDCGHEVDYCECEDEPYGVCIDCGHEEDFCVCGA